MTLIQESDGNKEEIIGLRERESGYGGQNKLVLRQVLEKVTVIFLQSSKCCNLNKSSQNCVVLKICTQTFLKRIFFN